MACPCTSDLGRGGGGARFARHRCLLTKIACVSSLCVACAHHSHHDRRRDERRSSVGEDDVAGGGEAASPPRPEPVKLFVASLSYDTTQETLRAAFSAFGNVREASIAMDRSTNKSRGFGFISFDDEAEAEAAMQGLNGQTIDGRRISVNVSTNDPAARQKQAAAPASVAKVFVGNMSFETTEATLLEAFAKYGTIREGSIITDKETGKSRGFAFVTFEDMASAEMAIAGMNKVQLDERELTVRMSTPAGSRKDGAGPAQSAAKLFIGGLSFDTTQETLDTAFGNFGTVTDSHIAVDKETGKPRGFGFVTFFDRAQAEAAIAGMHGKSVDGRALRVNFSDQPGT